jgi:hypothetical protein
MDQSRSSVRTRVKRLLEPTKSIDKTWPFIGPALAICGAMLWGSAMVYASMYARLPVPNPSAKTFLVIIGSVAGLFVASGAFGNAKRHLALWLLIFVGGLLAGGLSVVHLGVNGTMRISDDARQAFVDERHEFARSPAGFPSLAGTARDLWKVDVELDEVDGSPGAVVAAESDGSPATVEIHRGFCVINPQPRMAERYVGVAEAPEYRQDALWVAVAREIGRCVDVSRDEGTLLAGGSAFKSLAPADSYGISNAHDYFVATTKLTTRRWRDGYADAFAVGWMRLVKPEYARQLADTLLHDREERERASDMPDGNPTGCGIQSALNAPGLTSLADLPSWADGVRQVGCSR